MIKIILAEDHLVVRNGIKLLIDSQDNLTVVGEANNGIEVMELLEKGTEADIVLTDISMAGMDGIQLVERLQQLYPGIKVIMLSMLNSSQHVFQAFEKGAKGYLVKNVGYDELLFAIEHVEKGGRYLCEEIAMMLLDKLHDVPSSSTNVEQLMADLDISDRELEVLQLISEGYTNVEIADKLFLSKRTVEGHRQNLIDKTGVKNSAALIKLAVKNGLIK
ncbi:LuxR family two component transcriptional regulator [Sphingobacterium allocomposti]|uniref:LuxR family two component transcriptional regulator n=1 Tax=Sphingobacterium allocomposti TaxID=415956 RepID=A0A5S5D8Q8_9SPHI|nr:response regulator transcription factor [Sphingobacterium composti Yoo et al. 2007 non Ten et al. 2007]TYP92477.1 LuxR family two component transcriptional regulator [Sphingobacterium composti Yoo et al. 2007 non Ten et al. 2007]HLS95906.1 response regulator transcription factor [Sphingobacterium sp.]